MSFLYPTFLYALAAIAIPIIIHLFNFRRHKTVLFSSVKYLRNIKKETKAKSQLKHFLILLARILAVAALVMAFARPYIPVSGNISDQAGDVIGIYVDNSFSMDAENTYGQLFEVAKSKAPQILEAFRPDSRYLFLNNNFESKYNQFVNRDQLMDFVSEMKLSPALRQTSDVISRFQDFAQHKQDNKGNLQRAFLLSDFQKTSTNLNQIKDTTNLDVVFVPLATQPSNNMYIDSCWFESPGRKFNSQEELFARIVNNSDEVYSNTPIKLFINDSLKFLGSFTIKAQSEEIVKLSYTNTQKGILLGRIEITDYPVTYDNIFYFSYKVAGQLNILSISDQAKNKYVNALFSDDNYFNVSHAVDNNISFSKFAGYHLIIISNLRQLSSGLIQELDKYLANGGSVLFFPALDGDINSYNQMFSRFATNEIQTLDTHKTKVSRIDFEHPLFNEAFRKVDPKMDLPKVFKHFVFESQTRTSDEKILETIEGHSFLHDVKYAKGNLYVSAVPLDNESSNFTSHPIFVPAVYNMAFNSQGNTNLYYTLGRLDQVHINLSDNLEKKTIHIIDTKGKFDLIPTWQSSAMASGLNLNDEIIEAGNYYFTTGNKKFEGLSVNYDRNESDLGFYTNDELERMIAEYNLTNVSVLSGQEQTITDNIKEFNQGKQLWKLFILLSLLFISIEVLLIRLMK